MKTIVSPNAVDALRRAIAAQEQVLAEMRRALAEIERAETARSDFTEILGRITITVKEAAYLKGIGERAMYRRAKKCGVKIGNSWRIDLEKLSNIDAAPASNVDTSHAREKRETPSER